jgi:hypothetical protein
MNLSPSSNVLRNYQCFICSSNDLGIEERRLFKINFKESIHRKIIDLAIKVADGGVNDPMCRLELGEEPDDLTDAMNNIRLDTTEGRITQNFARYCGEFDGPTTREGQKDILGWWKKKKFDYPFLSEVARCLIASEASAAAIELDIGVAGMFLPKNRKSTRPVLLEMKLFIKRNKEFLDWNKVECLTEEMRSQYRPKTPTIPFVEEEEEEEVVEAM